MRLVVLGRESLDELQAMCARRFGDIPLQPPAVPPSDPNPNPKPNPKPNPNPDPNNNPNPNPNPNNNPNPNPRCLRAPPPAWWRPQPAPPPRTAARTARPSCGGACGRYLWVSSAR